MFKKIWKFFLLKTKIFLVKYVGKSILSLLIRTCLIEAEGVEQFNQLVKTKRCILMLWHNRITMTPFLLYKLTPDNYYTAVVSASRDGELLKSVVQSFKKGSVLSVGHQGRYQALQALVEHINHEISIPVITPDGPRGPCYKMKAGVAYAAIEAQASVVAFNWEATSYWELSTWDKLRFPKPFSTIKVTFSDPVYFDSQSKMSIDEALEILRSKLP
ncbi:MAG: DUF374 domain-containing protein [Parachlamydiaceae bacterium]|nr:DUF374 domain-containing protein [Parachlamydiaceae bacterium]